MAIIKQYDKRRDVTYIYESTSTWIPALKQSRAKRRLIGRLDPLTGEVVPTAKRGRHRDNSMASEATTSGKATSDSSESKMKERLIESTQEKDKLAGEVRRLRALLKRTGESLSDMTVTISKLSRSVEECASQLQHIDQYDELR